MIHHDLIGVQRSSNQLRQKLMESMYRHEYFREAEDLHKWINEQLQIASSDDYGTDYEHLLVIFISTFMLLLISIFDLLIYPLPLYT